MTTVYEPTVVEGYQWVLPADDQDFEVIRSLTGDRLGSSWKPLEVRLLKRDEEGRPLTESDLPWLGSHSLVLSKRALAAVGDLLAVDAELLPLACDDAELWLAHVCRIVDALDEDRSSVLRFQSSGRIMQLQRPVFRRDVVSGLHCFKLMQMPRGATFLTEAVVSAAESADLTGVRFRPVWTEGD